MSARDLESRRRELEKILRSANALLLEGYNANPGADPRRGALMGVETKSSPKDLVTVYDKKVEAHLFEAFAKSFPGETVIGEEAVASGERSAAEVCDATKQNEFWLVDPIDGTTNYSRAYPFFCTTAAFVTRKSPQVLEAQVGAVFNPVSQEMFAASRGGGAWLNAQRMQVTQVDEPQKALLTTGFASERSQSGNRAFELFQSVTRATLGVRRDGSAALDLAFVAAGRIDGYWEWGLAPWDTAAGQILVTESGGQVSDLEGQTFSCNRGEILASNGFLHKWLLNRIKEATR